MVLLFLSTAVAGLDGAAGKYRPEAVNDQVISTCKLISPCPMRGDKRAKQSG
jgi:hypothetical protein